MVHCKEGSKMGINSKVLFGSQKQSGEWWWREADLDHLRNLKLEKVEFKDGYSLNCGDNKQKCGGLNRSSWV